MRIVAVHVPAEWGGAERYTSDLLRGLAGKGHDVTAIVKPGSRLATSLEGSAVSVRPLDLGLAVGWHAAIGPLNRPLNWTDLYANPLRVRLSHELDALRAQGPIDVLHAQHVKEKLWVTAYAERTGVPVAWTAHAPLEPWMRVSAPGHVHRWARGRLDGLIAVNAATLVDYREWGFDPPVAEVVYNGFELEMYARGAREATRQELGLGPDQVAVLMPARPYVGKGVGVVLDALSLAASGDPELLRVLRVFVAGESRHVGAFADAARARGIGDHVTFLGHRDDMPDLLAASDVVTLPSFFEGLPYAISEAMAAGKPVVATRVGGIPEMIEDGENGILIDAGDAAALLAAFSILTRAPEVRVRMGASGRRIAAREFALPRMLDSTVAVFARLAAMRPKGRL